MRHKRTRSKKLWKNKPKYERYLLKFQITWERRLHSYLQEYILSAISSAQLLICKATPRMLSFIVSLAQRTAVDHCLTGAREKSHRCWTDTIRIAAFWSQIIAQWCFLVRNTSDGRQRKWTVDRKLWNVMPLVIESRPIRDILQR